MPTFGSFIFIYGVNVGKYSIHGWSGIESIEHGLVEIIDSLIKDGESLRFADPATASLGAGSPGRASSSAGDLPQGPGSHGR